MNDAPLVYKFMIRHAINPYELTAESDGNLSFLVPLQPLFLDKAALRPSTGSGWSSP